MGGTGELMSEGVFIAMVTHRTQTGTGTLDTVPAYPVYGHGLAPFT